MKTAEAAALERGWQISDNQKPHTSRAPGATSFGDCSAYPRKEGTLMSDLVAVEPTETAASRLLDEVLQQRLLGRVRNDLAFQQHFAAEDDATQQRWATRILDGTLNFLLLCASEPEGHYSPSKLVDVGWHCFLLYTQEYAAFCERIAGRFIHHAPSDVPGVTYHVGTASKTAAALTVRGLPVDVELWKDIAETCTGGDGCCDYCDPAKKGK